MRKFFHKVYQESLQLKYFHTIIQCSQIYTDNCAFSFQSVISLQFLKKIITFSEESQIDCFFLHFST